MLLNQLSNHVREMVLALRTEPVEVPDFITLILDSYARYQTGAMTHSVSIPSLLKRARAFFYNGLDLAQEIEDQRKVERHFAHWRHIYVNVSVPGVLLKQVTGLTTDALVAQNYALGHMNKDNMYQLLNILDTEYITGASGVQEKKVAALHGHFMQLEKEEIPSAPETLDDLFDENEDFHGIDIAAQGEYDKGHIWGRRPLSNVGNENVGGANERKMINRPQVYDLRFQQDGTTATDAAKQKPTLKNLEPILRRYAMVVKGGKLAYMWDAGFSALVQDILNSNLLVPQLIMGGAGWEFDIDCVKIAGTTIIADPNAVEGEMRVLHVGNMGMQNGTVFPYYYDPYATPVDYFAMKARMMSENRERPRGMDFGRPRPTPYQGRKWSYSDSHVDAIYSRVLLDWIPVLCVMRSHQLKIQGFDV